MKMEPEHVEFLKDQFKGAVASLTPEQVVKMTFSALALGAVGAEILLNRRLKDVERREARISRLDKAKAGRG